MASPNSVDLYNAKVIQASMGSFTRVQVYYTPLIPFLKKLAIPIVAATLDGQNLHEITLPINGALVVGNEATGVSPMLEPYFAQKVTIPRYGQAESLNVAVATGIICDTWLQTN